MLVKSVAHFGEEISRRRMRLLFDSEAEFCQTATMCYSFKRIVAVFLAIWVPLFSGNALAVAVNTMQTPNRDCHAMVVPASEHHTHRLHQHTQFATQDHSVGAQDQQDSSHKNCGVCHLACCGYMATLAIEIAEIKPLTHPIELSLAQFQSITLTPLDPPPLVRA